MRNGAMGGVDEKLIGASELESELKGVAAKAVMEGDWDKALAAVAACGGILYDLNQKYVDPELEDYLLVAAAELVDFSEPWQGGDSPVVLYYDRFGLDLRGLAASMLRAILDNGYRLHYVTCSAARGRQPNIDKLLASPLATAHYVDFSRSHVWCVQRLASVFDSVRPSFAYLYTTPNDVSGIAVFNALAGKCTRCQIDLTDHAFWLGVNAFDFVMNNRDMGQGIEHFERGIPEEKLLRSGGGSLYVDEDADGGPWPFDPAVTRYVFSGGSLYKTLGDPGNAYYRIVEHIVANHDDVVFWYAGEGDGSELAKLQEKYPDRVFHTGERPDFYQLIERCVFYLNTYPMFGGMMMRYAVNAGKLPITLKHGDDASGILKDQPSLQIEYGTVDELLADVDRLLDDDGYREGREALLSGCIRSREDHAQTVRLIVEGVGTGIPNHVEPQDTVEFRAEFARRFDLRASAMRNIACRQNTPLVADFPFLFARRALSEIVGKFNGMWERCPAMRVLRRADDLSI